MSILFADLKLGDRYILSSEDDPDTKYRGKIVDIQDKGDGHVTVQFDDEVGKFTWGNLKDPIHNFMEKDDGQD
jgi:hypothetical protein